MTNPLYLCANGLEAELASALQKLSPKEQLRLPAIDGAGFGAVHLALANGQTQCAKIAAACPVLYSAFNEQGQNCAHTVAVHSAAWPAERIRAACEFFRERLGPEEAASAAFAACSAGNWPYLEQFASCGMASPGFADPLGRSLLHAVCACSPSPGQEAALCALIPLFGAGRRSASGATPLHFACAAGNPAALGLLLGAGADPNACDNEGLAPADWACKADHDGILSDLLALGCAAPSQSARLALRCGSLRCLRAAAAMPQAKEWSGDRGITLAHLAAACADARPLRILEQLGYSLQQPDSAGKTPLAIALENPAFDWTEPRHKPAACAAPAGALAGRHASPSPAPERKDPSLEELARQNRELAEICLWLLRDKWIQAAGFVPTSSQIERLADGSACLQDLGSLGESPEQACCDPSALLCGLRAIAGAGPVHQCPQKRLKSI